jgi:guanosine-3',5'-bis(diphosphate) 3'-pyrophosphohydrolase
MSLLCLIRPSRGEHLFSETGQSIGKYRQSEWAFKEFLTLSRLATAMSTRLEQALRFATVGHQGQFRRSSGVPYVEHVVAVAWILDRAGFDEDVVIAGLLHDLVEDTSTSLADLEQRFGRVVAGLVAHCSEVKTDEQGRKRPWIDRKSDHLAALREAPAGALAIVLADKLHNLVSINIDLREGHPVWNDFHANRDQVLWYYRAIISVCASDTADSRLQQVAARCLEVLEEIERLES